MPIQKKDNLHSLIKSLTKNEKKFFRDFLKKQNDSRLYLLLFNKIDLQSKHQKDEIKRLFDNKANQLPVIRNYLGKVIEKVLNLYHRESSNQDKLYNNFLEVKRLLERELFDLAESKIDKCLELSKKSQSPFSELQSLELRKQLLLRKFGATAENCKKELVTIIENQNSLLKQIHNLNDLQHIQATFYEHFQGGTGLNPIIYSSLDKNPLLCDEKKALSMEAKLLQADLNYRIHIFKDKDFQQADIAVQKAIRQLELSPQIIQDRPELYLNLLNQRLQLLIHQKKITEIQSLLGKIRQAPTDYSFDIRQPSLRRTVMEAYALELAIYRQTGEETKANQLIRKITAEYKELNSPLLRQWRAVMDFEIAKFYFDTGKLDAAAKKVHEIRNGEYSQREAGILLRSIFLHAQIALLQKNNLELRKTSSQLDEHFIKIKKATRLEKNLLVFLKLWPDCHSFAKKRQKLISQLQKIQKAAAKDSSTEMQDLPDWIADFLETHKD